MSGRVCEVGEVAAATAGDQDFLARALGALEHRDTASAAAGFHRGHEACRASAEDEDIEPVLIHGCQLRLEHLRGLRRAKFTTANAGV